MSQESGTLVSLRYVREAAHGTTPAGVGTPVDSVAAVASGGSSGLSKFTRASGSWVTDGFVAGQWVKTYGFTTSANNGSWRVSSVSSTDLVVEDSGDVVADEAGDAGNFCRILMVDLRATGRSINLEKNILETAEVRSDRQKSDVRHGFNRVVGAPGFELSLASYDDLLELLAGRAWASVTTVTGINIASDASAKTFTRASGSFITDGYRVGDVVRVAGFTGGDTGNNGDWTVLAVTATVLTVADPDSLMTTVGAGASRTITYPGKRLDIGTVLSTMTLERVFAGVVKYQVFKGVAVDKMSLSVKPEAIVGGTFDLLGMIAAAMSGTPLSSVDAYPRNENTPFAAFDGRMFEGATPSLISVVTGVDLSFSNNRSLAAVVGSKTSPDVFEGQVDLTGTLTAFFQDETLLNKFINETESKMIVKLQDPDTPTDFMTIVLPRVKYTGGMMDPPQMGPVPLNMPFRALVQSGLAAAGGNTVASCMTIQRSNS